MTTSAVTDKLSHMETFDAVVALYYILKTNGSSLRTKQAIYRQDEVEALPLDFTIDVEIKTKRAVGQSYYDVFLRAVANENTEILPEYFRESLGRLYQEYRLGPDGPYAKLFFNVKNDQMRSFMKEVISGRFDATNTNSGNSGTISPSA